MKSRVLKHQVTVITQPFHKAGEKGYSYYHGGIDLVSNNGIYNICDWIVAHSKGTVVAIRTDCTGYEDGSYGNYVLLKHKKYYTMYAHLAHGTIKVAKGQTVKKGQVLGYMGNTGHSFGAHLHWEVRRPNGIKIDPEPYLNKRLPDGKLSVNGAWGKSVTKQLQKIFKTPVDGIVSNQKSSMKSECPACLKTSWDWDKKAVTGSQLIRAMQKWLKLDQTGFIDTKFIKRMQKKLKVTVSGTLDKVTVKALQKYLNKVLK